MYIEHRIDQAIKDLSANNISLQDFKEQVKPFVESEEEIPEVKKKIMDAISALSYNEY